MATIKDVAKMAQVSVATVSNVLNKTANVSEKTLNKVLHTIETLKFSPSLHAKNLRMDKSNLFAIVVSELDGTTEKIIEGIIDGCEKKGFSCNVYITHHNRSQEIKFLKELQSMGVLGIFLQTCDNQSNDTISSILNKNIPLIFIDNYIKNMLNSAIIFNNTSLVEDAIIKYIDNNKEVNLEKEDILLVSANDRYSNDIDAQIGLERVLKRKFNKFIVSATEEEAFYKLVKHFENEEKIPKLFISTRESITSALNRLVNYYDLDIDMIYLTNESEKSTKNRIALSRRAYYLGSKASSTMFKYMKSQLQFDKLLTIVGSKTIAYENLPIKSCNEKSLHLTLYDGPTASAIIPAIKTFMKKYNVDIKYTLLKYDELFTKISQISQNKDDSTDILMVDLPWFKLYNNQEVLFPLNQFIEDDNDEWLDNYSEEIKKIYFYTNSEIYSIPILTNMQFLFYRKDLFESVEIKRNFFNMYGIELNPPKTWREFELVAKFFTKKFNPDSPVTYGTTIQGMDKIALAQEFFPRQWAYGGKLISSRKIPIINSQANHYALLSLKNVYECTDKSDKYSSWRENFTKMINNEIAMSFNFSTHIGFDSSFQYMTDFSNIAVTQVPGNCSMLGGYNLGINAYSKNKKIAYYFIKWLTSGERTLNNTIMGCCIPHNMVFQDDKCIRMFPWLKDMQKYIISAKYPEIITDLNNRIIPPNVINNFVYDMVNDVFNGIEIPKILESSEEKLKDIINGKY